MRRTPRQLVPSRGESPRLIRGFNRYDAVMLRPIHSALRVGVLVGLFVACGDDGAGTGASSNEGGGQSANGGSQSSGGSGAGGTPAQGGGHQGGGGGAGGEGPVPSGWLFTVAHDPHVHIATDGGSAIWMGRGVNIDDLFLCGYNYGFWMTSPSGEESLLAVLDALMATWQPTFLRVSLSMNSFDPVVSWTSDNAYKASMTNVIQHLGAYSGTYVLVTLRSDTSMVDPEGNTCGQGDDAICLPAPATDDVYRALVDTFQDAPYVMFGVTNEPGGNASTDDDLRARMDHAVGVIREREDQLGVPHHVISVQGNQWTSQIGAYAASPLSHDNVVYEYHSYPPSPSGYTFSNIPVIIGEYGPGGGDTSFAEAFYADVEAKQIPNLAWDLSPFSNCAPDLLNVTYDASLSTTPWGDVVEAYLQAH